MNLLKLLVPSGIDVSRQAIAQRLRRETTEMLKATLDAAIIETLECVNCLCLSYFNEKCSRSTWLSLPVPKIGRALEKRIIRRKRL